MQISLIVSMDWNGPSQSKISLILTVTTFKESWTPHGGGPGHREAPVNTSSDRGSQCSNVLGTCQTDTGHKMSLTVLDTRIHTVKTLGITFQVYLWFGMITITGMKISEGKYVLNWTVWDMVPGSKHSSILSYQIWLQFNINNWAVQNLLS